MNLRFLIFLFALILLLSNCSLTRGLPEGQKIYYDTIIKLSDKSNINHKEKLKEALEAQSISQPIRGLEKLRVNIYNNNNKRGKTKGLAYWFQNKIGKPAVIYNPFLVETSRKRMEKYLLDQGYFNSQVAVDSSLGHRKVSAIFTIKTSPRYKINLHQQEYDSLFSKSELEFMNKKLPVPKKSFYKKELLDNQRAEHLKAVNDLGYFKVRENNFYFVLDTTAGNQQVDIYSRFVFKDSTEAQKYYFGNSLINTNYNLSQEIGKAPEYYNKLSIIQESEILRPDFINTLVWDQKGDLYNKSSEQELLQRFLATNLFKYVNIEYEEWRIKDSLFLDRNIYLTPRKMKTVNLDLQLHNSTGNIFGTQISGAYNHNNLFKGAEKLQLSASINGEIQTGVDSIAGLFNTLDYKIQASLGYPGIRFPFRKNKKIDSNQLPRTELILSNQLQNRQGFYFLNSATASLGYRWDQKKHRHQFTPISINRVDLVSGSDRLDSLLNQNQRLKESFEDLFILSLRYEYNFSKQSFSNIYQNGRELRGFSYSLKTAIETAGNLSSLLSTGEDENGRNTILGIPYSQFVKLDFDYRPQLKFKQGVFASRFFLGLGIPYGNSNVLPYTKQYLVGGANSMRAFDIRTLGPGTFKNTTDSLGNNFIDQTGDIRLELNLEYRFPIFSFFKGAVFTDIGNIWLAQETAGDVNAKKSVFEFNDFYKELGIGAGLGIRIDVELAVIRMDLATPIHDPREVDPWMVNNFKFRDVKWRFGIGYPF